MKSQSEDIKEMINSHPLMNLSINDTHHTIQLEKELEKLNKLSKRVKIFNDKMDRGDRRGKIKDILNG